MIDGVVYWAPPMRGKNGRVGGAVTTCVTVPVLLSVLGAVTVAAPAGSAVGHSHDGPHETLLRPGEVINGR